MCFIIASLLVLVPKTSNKLAPLPSPPSRPIVSPNTKLVTTQYLTKLFLTAGQATQIPACPNGDLNINDCPS